MQAGPDRPPGDPALVVLVHHGEAVAKEIDPQQPLTEAGRLRASEIAGALAERGIKPARVWHSGKLRARQTALEIWQTTNPLAQFGAVSGLQPTDHPRIVRDVLTSEARQAVCIGHMPNLRRLLAAMTAQEESIVDFPRHGAVALQWIAAGQWREIWRVT